MRGRKAVLFGLACVLVATGALSRAAEWPQWRGPGRDGVTTGVTIPDPWPTSPPRVWQTEVGLGHSSPVIADGKLVQHTRQGDQEVVACFDAASGKLLWKASYAAGAFKPQRVARGHGTGPFATPAIANSKVYTLGVSGELSCFDLGSGKVLWRHTFQDDYEKPYPTWGAANSPLVDGPRCVLAVGTDDDGALAAFHKDTGKALWRLTDDGPAYASAQAATLGDVRQVVTVTQGRVCGVAPETGKLLWQVPFKVRYGMNIVTPAIRGDTVVYSGAYAGTTAVHIAPGDGLKPTKQWHNEHESMFMSSPVRRGECLYGLAMRGRGKGALVCLALGDGTTKWSSPEMSDYASIVRVGDRLLVMAASGDLLLVAAEPGDYRELGRSKLTERPVWAHLAVVGDRLYVKDKT
ncbi:MAG: PQQ-binding-like beta-propeller repeat protein, partial [Planctomycetota bacterium]